MLFIAKVLPVIELRVYSAGMKQQVRVGTVVFVPG
jgi:hypothetical protein